MNVPINDGFLAAYGHQAVDNFGYCIYDKKADVFLQNDGYWGDVEQDTEVLWFLLPDDVFDYWIWKSTGITDPVPEKFAGIENDKWTDPFIGLEGSELLIMKFEIKMVEYNEIFRMEPDYTDTYAMGDQG